MSLTSRLPSPVKLLGYHLLSARYMRSWQDTRNFVTVYGQVKPYTMVVPSSLAALFWLTKEVDRREVEGDLVECGTWNGGSAAVIASATDLVGKCSKHRELWVFDSFQGLPPTTQEDGITARAFVGKLVGDPARVAQVLEQVQPRLNFHIVPGWFKETLPQAPIKNIALLHVDCDWYESVKVCLEHLYDKVSPGGVLVFNDYGEWPGAKRAVDEVLARHHFNGRLQWVDPGTRWLWKP